MAVLTDLPTELLEVIYRNLGSIDDVHHLARSCKTTHGVIDRASVYTDIMRSIIFHSPIHRYDIQLNRLLKFHRHIVRRASPVRATPLLPDGSMSLQVNSWEEAFENAILDQHHTSSCSAETITDEDVHVIIARWGGLCILQELWLERELRESDYLCVNKTPDANEFIAAYDLLADHEEEHLEGELMDRFSDETAYYTSFHADQRGRFYAAVTGLWLLNELRWGLTSFIYPPASVATPLDILDSCKQALEKQTETPLLDHLDRYAMHSFLYQHLLPLYSPVLSDQNSSKLPLTYPSELDKSPVWGIRLFQTFLVAGQTYLQPPDIIDLVVRDKLRRNPPFIIQPLPDSTLGYVKSACAPAFPPDVNLSSSNSNGIMLASISLTTLGVFERSTLHQTNIRPAPRVRQPPTNSLFVIKDSMSAWLEEQALTQFDMFSVKDRRDITEVFEKRWKTTQWMVWWWAASEDKARMQMERWRKV